MAGHTRTSIEHLANCKSCGAETRANLVWDRGWCDECGAWVDVKEYGFKVRDENGDVIYSTAY